MSPPDRANRGRGSWVQRGSVRAQSTTSRLSISGLKYRLYMRFGLYASYLVGNAPIPASILLGIFGGTDHLLESRGLTTSMLENETRRLMGWLPGEPGGRAVGGGGREGSQRAPQREREIVVATTC